MFIFNSDSFQYLREVSSNSILHYIILGIIKSDDLSTKLPGDVGHSAAVFSIVFAFEHKLCSSWVTDVVWSSLTWHLLLLWLSPSSSLILDDLRLTWGRTVAVFHTLCGSSSNTVSFFQHVHVITLSVIVHLFSLLVIFSFCWISIISSCKCCHSLEEVSKSSCCITSVQDLHWGPVLVC